MKAERSQTEFVEVGNKDQVTLEQLPKPDVLVAWVENVLNGESAPGGREQVVIFLQTMIEYLADKSSRQRFYGLALGGAEVAYEMAFSKFQSEKMPTEPNLEQLEAIGLIGLLCRLESISVAMNAWLSRVQNVDTFDSDEDPLRSLAWIVEVGGINWESKKKTEAIEELHTMLTERFSFRTFEVDFVEAYLHVYRELVQRIYPSSKAVEEFASYYLRKTEPHLNDDVANWLYIDYATTELPNNELFDLYAKRVLRNWWEKETETQTFTLYDCAVIFNISNILHVHIDLNGIMSQILVAAHLKRMGFNFDWQSARSPENIEEFRDLRTRLIFHSPYRDHRLHDFMSQFITVNNEWEIQDHGDSW